MTKLRIQFPNRDHSIGRGIGRYRDSLITALEKTNKVEVVDINPDLVHYTFFDPFYHTLPNFFSRPTIVTVHDVTPLVLPKLYPQGFRGQINLALQKYSLSKVSAVITDSIHSQKDIVSYLAIPVEKIHPIHLAATPKLSKTVTQKELRLIKEKYHLPEQFIFYLGGVNPNKNLPRLAKACQKLNQILVLGGVEFTKAPVKTLSLKEKLGLQSSHPELTEFHEIQGLIASNPLVMATGPIVQEDLSAVYQLATLYCQPSLYEGFGLTVLEAMTAGCLVVCANTSSLPEIYPTGTLTFCPERQDEIETALTEALSLTPSQKKLQLARQKDKAASFSWEKTAKATLAVYQSALEK